MPLFQKSVVNKYLNNLNPVAVEEAYKQFIQFYGEAERIENIRLLKEENYQEGFLREIFVDVLGYTINPNKNYNLTTEFKNLTDSKKADGAILLNEKAIGVIELKSTTTPNLESIRDQAFNYKNNQPNCRFVITSNFEKLRFYIDNATDWEEFNLFNLDFESFRKFYLYLSKDSIFNGITIKLKDESKLHEEDITGKLYNDYSVFKHQLFNDLIKLNPQQDKLLLFHKSQKLLDRILFVLFAEDRGLIPPNAITRIIDQWKTLKDLDEEKSLYSRFVKLFHHLDEGHKYKEYELPAYNGGLFKKDVVLDSLIITDNILHTNTIKLSTYDYNTEVDVNILGHIFENSITEIEQVKAEIEGEQTDKNRSRRKKEGIFYTPKYITKYIVDNTVGALCNEKKKELGIDEIENEIIENSRTAKGKLSKKAEALLKKLDDYRTYLLSLKILDPACGSGAFLNQALEFLINEHELIDSYRRELEQDSLGLYDTTKSILENNLYGVDINEEAVEIAKLSLWIRTAEKGRKLSDLNNNIKCGNSLIDDPAVAGDKAFDWKKEFPQVFRPHPNPLLRKERELKGEVENANGGFDVVIGNPPYVSANNMDYNLRQYFNSSPNYSTLNGKWDLYIPFVEKSLRLLNSNAIVGLIVPYGILNQPFAQSIRTFILDEFNLISIADLHKTKIFLSATVPSCIPIICKSKILDVVEIFLIKNEEIYSSHKIYKSIFIEDELKMFRTDNLTSFSSISLKVDKGKNVVRLGDITHISTGAEIHGKEKRERDGNLISGHSKFDVLHNEPGISYKPYIEGSAIPKSKTGRYCFPIITQYLDYNREIMRSPKFPELFDSPKIMVRGSSGLLGILATYDLRKIYTPHKMTLIICKSSLPKLHKDFTQRKVNLFYLLGLINSKLFDFYYKTFKSGFIDVYPETLKDLNVIYSESENEKFIATLVQSILNYNEELTNKINIFQSRLLANLSISDASSKLKEFYNYDFTTLLSELKKKKVTLTLKQQDEWEQYFNEYKTEINKLQQQITQTDKEIDQLVYKLYGLTEEEIRIVENQK